MIAENMIEDSVIHVIMLFYSHDCLKFGLWISLFVKICRYFLLSSKRSLRAFSLRSNKCWLANLLTAFATFFLKKIIE